MFPVILLRTGPWSLHWDRQKKQAQLRFDGDPLRTVDAPTKQIALAWASDFLRNAAQAMSDKLTELTN